MSSRNLQGNSINHKTLTSASVWQRNKWWPELPTVLETDQKFVGLHVVWPQGSNFMAFYIGGAAYGFYDVDFGDGYTQAVQNQSTCQYQFDYNSAALVGTEIPVSFVSSTNTVSKANHGYDNNQRIEFYNLSGSNLIDGQSYFVVNATTNEFQVSNVIGGSPLTLTDGTGSLLPYRLAVVTITPRAGINLSHLGLQTKSTLGTLPNGYSSGWLDIALAGPLTTLVIGGTNVYHSLLQRAHIVKSQITSFNLLFANCFNLEAVKINNQATVTSTKYMFSYCRNLQVAPSLNTSSVTDATEMFLECHSLVSVPYYDTKNMTTMSSMFFGCSSLATVPSFDTSNATAMNTMFANCGSLVSVPRFNTRKVTNMSSMFLGCTNLLRTPEFNTPLVTNTTSMFSGCYKLRYVGLFNTSNVTLASSMFLSCYALEEMPNFDFSKNTTAASMFNGCKSLKSIPHLNMPLVTATGSMFSNCHSLVYISGINTTSSLTTATSMFSNCWSLAKVPAINLSGVTSASNLNLIFNMCTNLSSIKVTGIKYSFTVANCKLSSAALDEIYTNLPTVASGTITVTGNWGTSGDTPNIAALKGWTVTGS